LVIFLAFLAVSEAFKTDSVAEFLSRPAPAFVSKLRGQDLADYVNAVQPFFRANYSKASEERAKQLMQLDTVVPNGKILTTTTVPDIPESFDAREKWPFCKSLGFIHDQSACGSCWAVSGASTMSDRLCIQTKGKDQTLLSDADLVSCCHACNPAGGCNGAWPYFAWQYVMTNGICSGGYPEDENVCKPYPFLPCEPHVGQPHSPCPADGYKTPACKLECQSSYKTKYQNDKHYAESAYYMPAGDVKSIQTEIMTHGPVQAVFIVYSDFPLYKKGIYVPTPGAKEIGKHAIKIIGWGVENNTPYWLIANSYNLDWGEGGYFRMVRGYNAGNIEGWVSAGMMKA
ncbi:papain family cysteine protease, partial [Oesophagostomum dentatum]